MPMKPTARNAPRSRGIHGYCPTDGQYVLYEALQRLIGHINVTDAVSLRNEENEVEAHALKGGWRAHFGS